MTLEDKDEHQTGPILKGFVSCHLELSSFQNPGDFGVGKGNNGI